MALRDTVRFPRRVLGPVERSAFLRLARILASDTGGLTVYVSGCGVSESCEGSCKDMRMSPMRRGIWSAAAATLQFLIVNANTPATDGPVLEKSG